jgi:starch phosphorylase
MTLRTFPPTAGSPYLPAAAAYRARAAEKGAVGQQVLQWQQVLDQHWAVLRFGSVKVETVGGQHVFEAQVYLADLDPEPVRVELYDDGVDGGSPVRQEMTRARQLSGAVGGYLYVTSVPASRPAAHYTPRVIPHHPGVAIPLEAARILWQR